MFKQMELLSKVDSLRNHLKKHDKVQYVLLTLMGLTWALFQYVTTEEMKFTDIIMFAVIGVIYLIKVFQFNNFEVAIHKIVASLEQGAQTINNLQQLLAQLNKKVVKDEEFRKAVDDKFNSFDDTVTKILQFVSQFGGPKKDD